MKMFSYITWSLDKHSSVVILPNMETHSFIKATFSVHFFEFFIINHIIYSIGHSKSFMITISPTYLFICKKNELLCTLLEYFREKKLPSDHHSHLGWECLQNYFYPILWNMVKIILFEEKRMKSCATLIWSFCITNNHHFSHLLVYMEKKHLWISMRSSRIFSREKTLRRLPIKWPQVTDLVMTWVP